MERPVKRRRQGASTFRSSAESNNETDMDELAEPSPPPSPDQGYQLAIKRAQANQRLNATMAHIIEKYSQSFDGIGDEIDMETGEIVVNNGHLSGMRHEGDLGGGDHGEDGDEGDDDDEGLLLEDLIDDSSDNEQVDDREVQDSDEVDNEGDDQQSSHEAEGSEENIVVEGQHIATESNSLLPLGGLGGLNMPGGVIGAQLGALASLFPNGYGGGIFIGILPGLGASPQGSEASKLTNGIPPISQSPNPMSMGPWSMPGLLSQETWGQLGVPNQQPPPPARYVSTEETPKPKGERYKFPAQNGDTSIWAPHSRQQDDNKPVRKRRAGKPARLHDQSMPVHHPPAASQSSSWEDTGATGSGRDDHEVNRRSGRVRKQVEYTGRVSWLEASKELELDSNPSSQSGSDPIAQEDPHEGEESASQGSIITSKSHQQAWNATKPKGTAETELRRVIPDSQDSATPPASSAPRPSQPQQPKEGQKDIWTTMFSNSGVDPALNLSDDEAPLPVLSQAPAKPHTETHTHGLDLGDVELESPATPDIPREQGAVGPTNGPGPKPSSDPKPKARRPRKDSPSHTTSSGSKRPVGRRRKECESPTIPLDSKQPVSQQQEDSMPDVSIKPKRTSRRLRNDPESPASAPNPKRKVGRPRKVAELPTASPPRELENLQMTSQALTEVVPLSDQAAATEGAQNQGSDSGQMLASPVLGPVTGLHKSTLGGLEEAHEANHTSPATKATPAISSTEGTMPLLTENKLPLLADDTMPLLAEEPLSVEEPLLVEGTSALLAEDITPQLADGKISQLAKSKQPQQVSTPKRKRAPFRETSHNTPQRPSQTPSRSSKPSTPRFTAIRTTRAPSSRRSILSLVSADSDSDNDELGRDHPRRPDLSVPRSSVASKIKAWRSSALTTEATRTPVKKRHGEPVSPGSVVKTPGGTIRTCGIGGYQCGRDFCFTCL